MIQTGREWLASPGIFRYCANAATLVPWPAGAGYAQVVLQIEMARFGIVFAPMFRTAITRCVCCASRWKLTHLAAVTWTGNLPLGAFASCRAPLPHAASA